MKTIEYKNVEKMTWNEIHNYLDTMCIVCEEKGYYGKKLKGLLLFDLTLFSPKKTVIRGIIEFINWNEKQ